MSWIRRSNVIWKNFWSTEFGFDFNLPAHDQRLTRGGPSMATPRGWSASLQISNRDAAATRGSVDLEYGKNEDGGSAFVDQRRGDGAADAALAGLRSGPATSGA